MHNLQDEWDNSTGGLKAMLLALGLVISLLTFWCYHG